MMPSNTTPSTRIFQIALASSLHTRSVDSLISAPSVTKSVSFRRSRLVGPMMSRVLHSALWLLEPLVLSRVRRLPACWLPMRSSTSVPLRYYLNPNMNGGCLISQGYLSIYLWSCPILIVSTLNLSAESILIIYFGFFTHWRMHILVLNSLNTAMLEFYTSWNNFSIHIVSFDQSLFHFHEDILHTLFCLNSLIGITRCSGDVMRLGCLKGKRNKAIQ